MIQKYRYLCALAKEKHFGRAAESCNVSQPTLSNGLRQLEEHLNVKLIDRKQKFIGLSPDGYTVLEYAKRILAEHENLKASLKAENEKLSGRLRLGVIPTALTYASHFIKKLNKKYPELRFTIESMSAPDLTRSLLDFELDLGISYVDTPLSNTLQTINLYQEEYHCLVHRNDIAPGLSHISWADAAKYPLGLLTPNMQNRKLADAAFIEAGINIRPMIESNSLSNLVHNVKNGLGASIIPSQFFDVSDHATDIVSLKLIDPVVSHSVGLLALEGEPSTHLSQAVVKLARQGLFNDQD
ncbi:LysR family transcriptional regulator [Terasakiella pusilla]|uniref:LysR family transcriptional regulator n=1 Tax=Terasakiella pusilla TaxID=64973 RepID=UPI00056F3B92|nr:LysR family transcriptional regulator [Terasakiella pusilla]